MTFRPGGGAVRAQVTAQAAGLSGQLASNLQAAGMANVTVDSLASALAPDGGGGGGQPVITDAAAAAAGVLGALLLALILALGVRHAVGTGGKADADALPEPCYPLSAQYGQPTWIAVDGRLGPGGDSDVNPGQRRPVTVAADLVAWNGHA